MFRKLVAATILALSLSGCIPLVVGGYIGYKMSESHEHDVWCTQHVDDGTCHP
jgi:hypothetical protein